MIATVECRLIAGRGLDTEDRKPGKREVTLLSAEAWAEVCRDLNAVLPWHTRRANILVEGLDFRTTIGRTLSIGEARIRIHGESRPCELMDKQYEGLRAALTPDGRGGIYGQVLKGGIVRIGSRIEVSCTSTP